MICTLALFNQRRGFLTALAVVLALGAPKADATVVRMNFTIGGEAYGSADFRMFDSAMPVSVANFLNYFDRYPGTFIHRNTRNPLGQPDGNFVVQGGGFEFVPPNSAPAIATDPPIADEPGGGVQGISNLRGTLSNAKSGPNTVTSQWFVNLDNNSFLDSPARSDGGFAAFGRVLGDGMVVFDAIDLLDKRDLDPPQFEGGYNPPTFNDVPVGDFSDPLATLVVLSSIEVLDNPDGDYNFDGTVDSADYVVWRDTLGSELLLEADGDGSGVVDAADYQLWRDNFGATSGSLSAGGSAAPEPAAAALAGLGLTGCLTRRRRRA